MKRIRICLCLTCACLCAGAARAQELSDREAGQYERKSITYVDALWLMDPSVRNMPNEYVKTVLEQAKKRIMLPRFDYNPLPEPLIRGFVEEANRALASFGEWDPHSAMKGKRPPMPVSVSEDPMLDTIAAVMERTMVPKILEIVDAQKEMRAARLTTEQERNSFFSDKAKSLGITMEQIEKVMNSAYIFIPLARHYGAVQAEKRLTMMMDVGIVWYRIDAKGERARALPVVRNFTTCLGFGIKDKKYVSTKGVIDHHEFAFRALVKNAARNLEVATRQIPAFNLSGQVVEVDGGTIGMDLGKNEGVRLDDRYLVMSMEERADGSVNQRRSGWVMVSFVADSSSREGYKSKADVVAGDPMQGEVLKEYARLPIDISVQARTFAVSDSTVDLVAAGGVEIDAYYNIGRYMGIRQLWLGGGYGIGANAVDGNIAVNYSTYYPKTVTVSAFQFELVKKFYLRRLSINGRAGFGAIAVTYTEEDDIEVPADIAGAGPSFGGGMEIVLSPSVLLGAQAVFQAYSQADDSGHDVEFNGVNIGISLTWSPPALPFDPFDMLRAYAGI